MKGHAMYSRIALALLLAVSAGCAQENPLLSTPEGIALDAYLKAHLNDPAYEVVEWHPAKSCKARNAALFHWLMERERAQELIKNAAEAAAVEKNMLRAARAKMPESELKAMQERVASTAREAKRARDVLIPKADQEIARIESGEVQFCGLNYRARNASNELTLYTQVFRIIDGDVKPRLFEDQAP